MLMQDQHCSPIMLQLLKSIWSLMYNRPKSEFSYKNFASSVSSVSPDRYILNPRRHLNHFKNFSELKTLSKPHGVYIIPTFGE